MSHSVNKRILLAIGVLAIALLLAGCTGLGDEADDLADEVEGDDLADEVEGDDVADEVEGDEQPSNETDETDEDSTDETTDEEDEQDTDADDRDREDDPPDNGDDDEREHGEDRSAELEDRIQAEDTQIHPGQFTELEANLLVGAHPHAIDEPHEIELSAVDPTDPAGPTDVEAYEFHEANIEQRGEFFELRTASGEPLESAAHTKFYVTIPVPDGLDTEHLQALSYEDNHLELGSHPHEEDRDLDPDGWKIEPGTYDEQFDAFVVQLEGIGGDEHPTRLGVVEHTHLRTTPEWQSFEFPDVELLATEHFPALESERWDPDPVRPPDVGMHGSHVYEDDFSAHEDTAFYIRCNAADCNMSVAQEHRNYLDHAYAVYFDELQGDPYPDIRTDEVNVSTDDGYAIVELFRYNIEDYHSDSGCEDSPGWYSKRISPVSGHGYTCLTWDEPGNTANDPLSTTGHELFHGMQYSYRTGVTSDDIIVESTARLAQDYETHTQAHYEGPWSLPFLNESMVNGSYAWDNFYEHLLETDDSVEFADLAVLFDDGMNFDSLEELLGEDQHRPAYWEFVTDTVYEQEQPTVNDTDGNEPDRCTIDVFEQSQNTFVDEFDIEEITDPSEEGAIHPDGSIQWRVDNPPAFSSHVTPISLPAEGYDPYYAIIDVEMTDEVPIADISDDSMGMDTWMGKVFDDHASEYEGCGENLWLEDAEDGQFKIPVYGEDRETYFLQSNMNADWFVPGESFVNSLSFEPIPEDEIPYPAVENLSLEFPVHPDDHDGYISDSLDIYNPDGDDDLLDFTPTSTNTDAGNSLEISEDDYEVTYELGDEHWSNYHDLASGEYTDNETYHVTNERHNLTSQGEIEVYRDVDPIAFEVNYSYNWGLEEIDPVTPKEGPVCDFPVNQDDVNPMAYGGTPYSDTELFILDAWDADPTIGSVDVNDDSKTVHYEPTGALDPWQFSDRGPDGYQTEPSCTYLDSFMYEVENSFRDRIHTGNAVAEVNIYNPLDDGDDSSTPVITPEDWLDVYVDTLLIDDRFDIQVGNVGGFQAGSYGMMTLEQDSQRTAYFQPGEEERWQHLGPELEADLVMTGINERGQSAGWIAGTDFQGVTFDANGNHQELPAGGESVVLDINSAGETVGHAEIHEEGVAPSAVLWTHNEPFAIDAELDDGSLATALNDNRQVVGIHGGPVFEDGLSDAHIDPAEGVIESMREELFADDVQGFVYDWDGASHPAEGTVTELGSLGGGATIPTAVNDQGAVVGASTVDEADPSQFHAFYWQDGHMEVIELPDSAVRSTATAVNDDGYVVGSYEREDGERRGFLWHPRDGFTDLDTKLVHDDWTLVEATDINDEQQVQVTVQVAEDIQWPMTLEVPR